MSNTIRAGRITGNPMLGLCERICIEVPRVLDGCSESGNNVTFTFAVSQISPQAVPPFNFVCASSTGNASFENTGITLLNNGRSRVEGDVVIPVTVTLCDAYENAYTAVGNIRLHRYFILNIPERSLIPYEIKAFAAFSGQSGSFLSDNAVSVTGCYRIIVKVIVLTDILVPSYGRAVYPECTECVDEVCNIIFSDPI